MRQRWFCNGLSRVRWQAITRTNANLLCVCANIHAGITWRHNWRYGVSKHQTHECLLSSLPRRRSKKRSKLHVIGLFEGNSPVTGKFPAQRASNAENAFISWRHHDGNTIWGGVIIRTEPIDLKYSGISFRHIKHHIARLRCEIWGVFCEFKVW